jgi:hypothetical protein
LLPNAVWRATLAAVRRERHVRRAGYRQEAVLTVDWKTLVAQQGLPH